jgi:phage gpG-like protein
MAISKAPITITIEGANRISIDLGKLAAQLSDLSPAMKESGDYLTGFYSGEVFASRGGVIGKPWPSLTPSYAVWKAEQFPGRPPLIRTGEMNRSFKYEFGAVHARIFNTAKYFDAHQQGTRRVPARVMMALDLQRARRVQTIINNYVAKKVSAV